MASTKLITELTLATFATGALYAIGQSTRIGWFYLNTFSYKDFLIYAVLVLPIALAIFAVWTFASDYIVNPVHKVAQVMRKSERQRVISQFGMRAWIGLIIDALEVFVVPVMIIFMIIFMESFYLIVGIGFLALAISTITTRVILKLPPRDQRPKATAADKEEGTDKASTYMATASILVFFAGAGSIDLQNHEKADSEILFDGDDQYVSVNILASNSNSVAYWVDESLYITPRSEIRSVRYKYAYVQHLHSSGHDSDNSGSRSE